MIRRFIADSLMPRKWTLLEMWAAWIGGIIAGINQKHVWVQLAALGGLMLVILIEGIYHDKKAGKR